MVPFLTSGAAKPMKFLDLTLPTPAENVACDEALLESREREGGDEILRVWESSDYFVVVGYSNDEMTEVNLAACRAKNIPVLRRCSGGGAVVLGRGCLNYALILEIARRPEIGTLAETNRFVMQRNCEAVQAALAAQEVQWQFQAQSIAARTPLPRGEIAAGTPLLRQQVEIHGATDLAIGGRKFSGNSQRRGRKFVLFHGSLLLNFDLSLIEELLPMPTKQPRYRRDRAHSDFLMNLDVESERVKVALKEKWAASAS